MACKILNGASPGFFCLHTQQDVHLPGPLLLAAAFPGPPGVPEMHGSSAVMGTVRDYNFQLR